jgi:integrase
VNRPKLPERKARPWTLAQVESVAAVLQARWAVFPYVGARTGMRQGEMLGLAVEHADFLRRVVHVRRQVRITGGKLCYAPVKNDKGHDVPLADSLALRLSAHIAAHSPRRVTLPWRSPDGQPESHDLILTTRAGTAVNRTTFNGQAWHPALVKAGIREADVKGLPEPGNGCHVLRHTAASAWLSAGVSVAAVAAWLGDSPAMVLAAYAHMMPDAHTGGRAAIEAFFSASAPGVQKVADL